MYSGFIIFTPSTISLVSHSKHFHFLLTLCYHLFYVVVVPHLPKCTRFSFANETFTFTCLAQLQWVNNINNKLVTEHSQTAPKSSINNSVVMLQIKQNEDVSCHFTYVSHSFLRWHSPLALSSYRVQRASFYIDCAHWLWMWIWAPSCSLRTSYSLMLSLSPAVDLCTLYILYHQLCIPSKFVCISSWMLSTFMLVRNFTPWHAKSIFAYHCRIYATETAHSKCTPAYCQLCGKSKLRFCMHIIAYRCGCHWPATSSNDQNVNHLDWLHNHHHHRHWFE